MFKSINKNMPLVGIFIWAGAVILRTVLVSPPYLISLALGVAPNVGSALVLAGLIQCHYARIMNKVYSKKVNIMALILIFIAMLLSEVIHANFLNSPFDVNDMLASVITLVLIGFYQCSDK